VERKPDWVVVYGDVNSTMAAALVCSKVGIRAAHVEAGLRSGDRTMPEEINRILTDQLADLLFTPSAADKNLHAEGIEASRIRLVGNVMIDTLVRLLPLAENQSVDRLPPRYALVTLHRPSNVDDLPWLRFFLCSTRSAANCPWSSFQSRLLSHGSEAVPRVSRLAAANHRGDHGLRGAFRKRPPF
jgi:UDP-N-acetylglucosamine 2-epimerase (non-hydrolysing)